MRVIKRREIERGERDVATETGCVCVLYPWSLESLRSVWARVAISSRDTTVSLVSRREGHVAQLNHSPRQWCLPWILWVPMVLEDPLVQMHQVAPCHPCLPDFPCHHVNLAFPSRQAHPEDRHLRVPPAITTSFKLCYFERYITYTWSCLSSCSIAT